MSDDWLNDLLEISTPRDDGTGEFYCPYTNGAECALLAKGWQPQELCRDLECEQMKFAKRAGSKRRRAA